MKHNRSRLWGRRQTPAPALPSHAELISLFIEDRIARGLSPHTIRSYRDRLAYFAQWAGDRPLTRATLRSYLADLQQRPISPVTVSKYFLDLKAFCAWLVEEELIPDNPARKLLPKVPRRRPASYSQEQIERLLHVCNVRDRAIVIMFLDTGLRRAELLQLQRRNISITGHFSVIGKGNKERSQQLSPYALHALWAYLGTRTDNHPALWYGPQGMLTDKGLYERIKELCKRAGIRGNVRRIIHGFRATFARNYLIGGGDLESLRQLMGHTHIEQTAHYAELVQTEVEAKKRQINPLGVMVRGARHAE